MDVFFMLLTAILLEFHKKPSRKHWITEKSTQKNLCDDCHFLAARPPSYVIFCGFFVYSDLQRKKVCSRKWGKARVRGCCPSTLPLPLSYSPVSGPTPFQFDEGYCKFWDTKHLQKNKYEILCILLMVNNMFVDEENKNCF